VRLQFVFFRILRTLWYEMRSTYSNSTILSASKRNVHWLLPSGAWLQAKAVTLARVWALIPIGLPLRGFSLMVPATPAWTYRFRIRATVPSETSTPLAISGSVLPSAASRSILARFTFLTFSVPCLVSFSSWLCSSSLSSIVYTFFMAFASCIYLVMEQSLTYYNFVNKTVVFC